MSATVLVTGGFDPLHSGHIALIREAATYGRVVIGLNSDEWLRRKKGFALMPWDERAAILMLMSEVKDVVSFDDALGDAADIIMSLKPKYFVNGGDRKNDHNLPLTEVVACHAMGTEIIFTGQPKVASSSAFAMDARAFPKVERPWGFYEVYYRTHTVWVKRLHFRPFGETSVQKHKHRTEIWLLVEGSAMNVSFPPKDMVLSLGHPTIIGPNEWHQIVAGPRGATVLEIAHGYPDENDIVREER